MAAVLIARSTVARFGDAGHLRLRLAVAVAICAGFPVVPGVALGASTFGSTSAGSAGAFPFSVAVGVLNGDGCCDLATADLNRPSMTVPTAGYVSLGTPFLADVDTSAPVTTDDVPATYRTTSVSVTLSATDDGAGVDKTYFEVGASPAEPTTLSAVYDPLSKPTLAAGEKIRYFSVDLAGNAEVAKTSRATTVLPATNYFVPATAGATARNPETVAIGDLNGDGLPDLVTSNSFTNSSSTDSATVIMRKADNSGWDAPAPLRGGGTSPHSVAIGDLNGDGKLDLALANETGARSVSVILRKADNTGWDAAVSAGTTDVRPYSVAIADLNGDGRMDLATANYGASTVSVILRKADNSGWEAPATAGATGGTPQSIAVGDLNGDGRPDLATADLGGRSVTVITRSSDNAGWDAPSAVSLGTAQPTMVSIGDLDGDGRLDLATAHVGGGQVSVITRKADNSGWNAVTKANVVGTSPTSVAIGDLNGDGRADMATANAGGSSVAVFTRKADNSGWNPATVTPTGAGPTSVAIGDLDGDGRPDLATADRAGSSMSVLTGAYENIAPTTTDDVPTDWVGSPPAVTLAATDTGGSGVAKTYYTTSGAPPSTASTVYDAAAKPTLSNGLRIRYLSVDGAGNQESAKASVVARVDTTAPVTTDSVDTSWHDASVSVTLTPSDAQSGVETTYYEVGTAPETPMTSSAVYSVGAKPTLTDGQRISYFTVDAVGNAEAVKTSRAANVDGAAPTTTDDVDASWHSAAVSVTLTATDTGSAGVATTYYRTGVSPETPTTSSAVYSAGAKPTLTDGQRISYFSVDAAGNPETVKTSAAAKVDATAPETVITAAPAASGSDPRPQVAFSTSATDATFECSLDDAAFTSCTSPFQPSAALLDGPHAVAVRAVSRADIRDASPAVASFTVDTRSPSTPVLLGAPPAQSTSTTAQIAFATDPDATADCQVDGGVFSPCASPLTLTGLAVGDHTVTVRQTDAAGNPSSVVTISFTVLQPDAPPSVEASPSVDAPFPGASSAVPPILEASTAAVLGTKADSAGRYPVIVRDGVASIGCSVSSGVLASCSVRGASVRSLKASPKRLPAGTLLVTGSSATGVAASRSLAVGLQLTKRGRSALARRPLGVTARVTVTSRATTGAALKSTVLVRLQSANRLVLPVRGHGTALSASTKKLLARMGRTVTAAKTVTCVADTDAHGTAASDLALTRKQARVACAYLRDRGIQAKVRSSGSGHQRPRASNRTARGRALNRRLTITTTY